MTGDGNDLSGNQVSGNEFSGHADAVVQAENVYGGVHFHYGRPRERSRVPWQVPPAAGSFENRAAELAKLRGWVDSAVRLGAVSGMPGAGR